MSFNKKKQAYSNSLFRGLDNSQIDSIIDRFEILYFSRHDYIIRENTRGDSIYLLMEGDVVIDKNLITVFENAEPAQEDKKIEVMNHSMNVYFGEMSFFDKKFKRSASVIADSDVTVAKLTIENFEGILQQDLQTGIILLKNIGFKLSFLLDKAYTDNSKLVAAFSLALKL